LAENPRQTGSDSVAENVWRSSAEAVPEFIRPGPVYPPDFHELNENERKTYLQALEKFRQGDFSGVKELISKIVPKDHRSPLAETLAFFKADCAFQRAEKGGAGTQTYMFAIQNFREAMTEFPQSRFVPYAVLMMATGYRRIKFFQEAVVQYEFFLTHFLEAPAASEALFWKAESLFQTGRYGDAKTVFEAFADRSPHTVHGRIAALRVGDCFYKMGDLEKARHEYGRVLSEPSDFSYYPLDSLLHAGLTFLENKDFEKGREILFRAANLDPESKRGRAMMEAIAQSYLTEDLDEEALRVNLLLCQSLGEDDLKKMELLRLADLRLSRPQLKWPPLFVEAYLDPVGVYQDFLDHTQDMSLADEVMYRQALALAKRGDFDEAVGKLERILSLRHQDSLRKRSASLLSYSLNSLIQGHHGREDLEVVRLYKSHAFFLLGDENMDKGGLLLVAESLQNVGLLEDALAVYRHLRGVSGLAHDHVLFQIGRILFLQGEKEAAREAFEDLSKSYPDSLYLPEVQKLLGDLSFGIGDYAAAIQWYRLALVGDKVGAGLGRSYAHLGRALKMSGRYREAMDAYQKAIDSVLPYKDQAWAREILVEGLAEIGVYHEDQGRVLEAVESYGRIIGLSPPEDRMNWALYRLGESYRKIGNTEMMEQTFEDLNQRSPNTLWSKLARQVAGGVAVDSMVAPYIKKVGKYRPR